MPLSDGDRDAYGYGYGHGCTFGYAERNSKFNTIGYAGTCGAGS